MTNDKQQTTKQLNWLSELSDKMPIKLTESIDNLSVYVFDLAPVLFDDPEITLNILLIAPLNSNIRGNLLKVLARGTTTSSSNLDSPLFKEKKQGRLKSGRNGE